MTFSMNVDIGEPLAAQGMAQMEMIRVPRAIDQMKVILRKRKSTPEEREEHDRLTRSFRLGALDEWNVR